MPRGIPFARESYRAPLRFMKKVSVSENGCWIWPTHGNHGYGVFRLREKCITVHRAAYLMFVGEIPHGKEVHHLCRNRRCVYPGHLETIDKREHGRLHNANTGKTHCKRGHPLSGDNLEKSKNGRTCRACHEMKSREWRERHRI